VEKRNESILYMLTSVKKRLSDGRKGSNNELRNGEKENVGKTKLLSGRPTFSLLLL
jgi:hypothetical protein